MIEHLNLKEATFSRENWLDASLNMTKRELKNSKASFKK
jgi:hypothetical protein